ncbi:hypothetical protein [Rhizobium sp. Leaf384]|nr:hypothetical protein [Rhizobium sp. Leaf384]
MVDPVLDVHATVPRALFASSAGVPLPGLADAVDHGGWTSP